MDESNDSGFRGEERIKVELNNLWKKEGGLSYSSTYYIKNV